MSCFPTSEAAFAQEMLLSAVSARVFVISFLLENIFLPRKWALFKAIYISYCNSYYIGSSSSLSQSAKYPLVE